jgi:hypothetical protein
MRQGSFGKRGFDSDPIARLKHDRFALAFRRALRPTLFVAIAIEPDKTAPNVRRVTGDLFKSHGFHVLSSFRLAGVAGMVDTVQAIIAYVNNYFQAPGMSANAQGERHR